GTLSRSRCSSHNSRTRVTKVRRSRTASSGSGSSGPTAGFQRVLAPLVEFVLQAQALLVRFDRADRLHDPIDPRLRFELADLARRSGADAGIVVREPRVPPDAGVEGCR